MREMDRLFMYLQDRNTNNICNLREALDPKNFYEVVNAV